MASQPLPMPAVQAAERVQKQLYSRTIPVRTVVAVFGALLILFAWLHFVLALQIASTNRQIYEESQELARVERHNAVRLLRIAEAESPQNLEQRAIQVEYRPQQPRYLMVKQTSVEGMEHRRLDTTSVFTSGSEAQTTSMQDQSLAQHVAERLGTWLHIDVGP